MKAKRYVKLDITLVIECSDDYASKLLDPDLKEVQLAWGDNKITNTRTGRKKRGNHLIAIGKQCFRTNQRVVVSAASEEVTEEQFKDASNASVL